MHGNLTPRDFNRLSTFIYNELGIKMPESKNSMLKGRLSRRLRVIGLSSYREYCDYLFSEQGQEELVHFINAVTTNKTDFFREPGHFDYLVRVTLPTLLNLPKKEKEQQPLRVWSAGCSTGEEPYTLAMVLSEAKKQYPGLRFEILATDISTKVLSVARRGIYPMDRIDPISMAYRKQYLLRGKGKRVGEVRIAPELRKQVLFGRLNFMDKNFALPKMQDVIFCRNVIIYFDKATQEQLMHKFCQYLRPGGYIFLGHSESLYGYSIPLTQVAPTVYRTLQ